ncbi:hypothetical protein [Infirmifilum sp. SLHALR2]|nr:MAG: hypothetical protein B7L53_00450 [Thermofilum sp. NZ13]
MGANFGEDAERVLGAMHEHGTLDANTLSEKTGLPREKVELLIIILRDLKKVRYASVPVACTLACEKCPLARSCKFRKS